jgi:signal transduction histidine kinase
MGRSLSCRQKNILEELRTLLSLAEYSVNKPQPGVCDGLRRRNSWGEAIHHPIPKSQFRCTTEERVAKCRQSLADAVSESWTHADTASAELKLTVPEDATVMADRNRLLQVFENLFRNTVDPNDLPLAVRVGLLDGPDVNSDAGHQGGLFIEDDGDGIPADERGEVFAHGHTTSEEGTGFGLSIVTDVVDAHGWDIIIAESDEGGARFEITGVEIDV